ncbi:MAG TPA: multiheme c-type cytochrome [Pirellulales bacterium]
MTLTTVMCMFQKTIAAAAAFLVTLAILHGCSPQGSTSPAATTTASAKPNSSTSDVASAQPKPTTVASPSTGTTATATTAASTSTADSPAKTASEAIPPASKTADPPVAPKIDTPPSAAAENGGKPGGGLPKGDEPLFQGWPKPLATIVATGMQMGYIEPCGCSGKENQLGGLSRRDSFLKKLAANGWNVIPLDAGGQVRRFGTQSDYKFQRTADALKTMHYRAIALGTDDLRLPAQALAAPIADNSEAFVSANAAPFGFDAQLIRRFQIIDAGKIKFGVTAIVGDSVQRAVNNDDIKFKPAEQAIKEVLPDLKKAGCDHLILLAHATQRESIELAKKFPEFDFVITSGGAPEPPRQPETIEGMKTRLIEVGQKGEYANVIGFFDDPEQPVRFRMVPLELKLGESDEMRQLMASYQDQLQQAGLSGLGIKPAAHPTGRTFVGSQTCGDCHTKAYAIWLKTPHAKALETLEKLKPARNFDPECLSCHVTGCEPQKFYPYEGGYTSLDKTPQLAHNGCENCHGPGSAHVAAENGGSDAEKAKNRVVMRAVKSADTCIQCHDADNSLKFDFNTYWPKVEHHGKD